MFSWILLLGAAGGGAVATYAYDNRANLGLRLCVGACLGTTAWALVGFALASALGLNAFVSLLSWALVVGAPLLLVPGWWERLRADVRRLEEALRRTPRVVLAGRIAFYLAFAVVFWLCYERAMFLKDDGVYTGYIDNFADLTLHLGIIAGFTDGANFPPEHPEFSGTRLSYPFLVDFGAAMMYEVAQAFGSGGVQDATGMRAMVWLRDVMFAQIVVLSLAILGIAHHWGLVLTRDRAAARLVPLMLFLNGGLGFYVFFEELWKARGSEHGMWHFVFNLPHDYTAYEALYRWANSIVYWFVPMRSMLLGVPLFLIVTGLWWRAMGNDPPFGRGRAAAPKVAPPAGSKKRIVKRAAAASEPAPTIAPPPAAAPAPEPSERRQMVAAGLIAGLLPLAHAHTFATLMLMAGCLCLYYRRWASWIISVLIAGIMAIPQVLWVTIGSEVRPATFFAWHFGWTHDKWHPVEYWFRNTGLFIPLVLVALLWKPITPQRLRAFYMPFLLCFIIPNMVKLAPWEWDNIKVLIYWFIPSLPLVALLFVRLWRRGGLLRPAVILLFVSVTLSGALDVWRVLTRTLEWRDFDTDQLAFAEFLKENTPPRAIILNAGLHNTATILSGRRAFMGYPGRLWTHGLHYVDRETDLKAIYLGGPPAVQLLAKHKIDYVVIGPMEIANLSPNREFFESRYVKIGEAGGHTLYKVAGGGV